VLLDVAGDVAARHDELASRLTHALLADVVADVPDEWLEPTESLPDTRTVRAAYVEMLSARLAAPHAWLPSGGAR
jgi:hypothetical protein